MGNKVKLEKASDFKGTMKKLFGYMKEFRLQLVLVFLCAIGSTIFSIVGPKILGKAITEIFKGLVRKISGGAGIDFEKLAWILGITLGLYLLSAGFSFIQGFFMTEISQKMTYRMRKELSEKINRMPMNYFDTKTHGETLSRITNDVDVISQSLNQSATQLITSFTTIVGVLIMMISISWKMTLLAMVILPLSGLLVSMIVKRSQSYFMKQQEYLGELNGHIEESFGGQQVIKAFCKEEDTVERFHGMNEKLYETAWISQFLSGMMMPMMQFVGNIGYVGVALLGGYLTIQRSIEVGDIQSFIQYMRNFTQPISQVAQVANLLQSTGAAAERVFEFLEEAEEEIGKASSVNIQNGDIDFEHVKFGYSPGNIIIKDFSAHVKAGQKIAIVGPTGAGKTTMVKLLMRFYDVNEGSIFIDGQDIKNMDRGELRRRFGMVLQDTWLFHGTIRDNIRYGKPDATEEEVIAAAKAAHAHHFIKTLPGGYDMVLNEEATNVSQGQKQLLTIARAILTNPSFMILDEATSSVDTRTEVRIQKGMANLMKGRTSFVIAHRLSTIKDADVIFVMKDGDIIEQGNHEELLKQHGFYANLYMAQFQQIGA